MPSVVTVLRSREEHVQSVMNRNKNLKKRLWVIYISVAMEVDAMTTKAVEIRIDLLVT